MTGRRAMLLFPFVPLWAAESDESVWQDFVAWYRDKYKGGPAREEFQAYLTGAFDAGEAKRRQAIVERMMAERDDLSGIWFDRVYTSQKPQFRIEPNAFLVECVRRMKPGRALDVAMGQGRNAVYLARQGWRVTGFDISREGVAAARANARQAGVEIEAVEAPWQKFDFGRAHWDLVVFSYAFVPITEPAFARRVVESLTPGGVVVYEHFMKENGRGPKGSPETGRLREAFAALEVLRYEEAVGRPDWAQNDAKLVRMLAQVR